MSTDVGSKRKKYDMSLLRADLIKQLIPVACVAVFIFLGYNFAISSTYGVAYTQTSNTDSSAIYNELLSKLESIQQRVNKISGNEIEETSLFQPWNWQGT